MRFLKKYWWEIVLVIIYSILRLPFLLQIPLFEDEALYIGWSLEMIKNIANFSLPMKTGISPLFSWVSAIVILIIDNPIIAGRLVSLVCGGISVIIFYKILNKITIPKISFLFSLIFLLLPINIVYNRLALLESMLIMFILLTIFQTFNFQITKTKSLIFYSTFLSLSMLTKIIGLISAPVIIIASCLVNFSFKKLIKYIIYTILGVFIFVIIFYPFKLQASSLYESYTFISLNPVAIFGHLKKNLFLTYHWVSAYFSLPLLFFSILGILTGLISKNKNHKYLSLLFIGFGILIPYLANLFFPRHLMVLAPFIVISLTIFYLFLIKKNKFLSKIFILLIFIILLRNDWMILKNPKKNDVLAKEDVFQFYEDWTSGNKLPDIANYFDEQIKINGKIIIYTDETGLYYYGLPVYIKQKKLIEMKRIPLKNNELNIPIYIPIYMIANRYTPEGLNPISQKVIKISDRHEVKILRIK